MDKGGENEVFHDGNTSVIKLNNFEYAGDDLENFFIRIYGGNMFQHERNQTVFCKIARNYLPLQPYSNDTEIFNFMFNYACSLQKALSCVNHNVNHN